MTAALRRQDPAVPGVYYARRPLAIQRRSCGWIPTGSAMPKNYICDMDGVLVRGSQIVPGANEFIQRLQVASAKFLVLTNNSLFTQRDLHVRLQRIGLDVPPDAIYTSALATAQF